MRCVERTDDGEFEWGFPKRLQFMSFAKSSMSDFGYSVAPAWSRYVVSKPQWSETELERKNEDYNHLLTRDIRFF